MRWSVVVGGVLASVTLSPILVGCGQADIPTNASTRDFCGEGEKFSASTSFKEGVAAAEKLGEVGTPKNITAGARAGFVELVERVTGSDSGADFKKKQAKLTKAEATHLADLNEYIQKTCDLS
ncbi:MAG: hypothetical protein J7518_00015 [Nocardioidaceae bacterium]|nr:hypothetical protein [Nocardioidaceae bacterium]